MAAQGLKSQYEIANGFEGQMLTGKGAPNKTDVFRSQAEVIQAMNDPRYDKDPAYRNDVFEKTKLALTSIINDDCEQRVRNTF